MEALMYIGGGLALVSVIWAMSKFHQYVDRKYNFKVFSLSGPLVLLILAIIGYGVAAFMYNDYTTPTHTSYYGNDPNPDYMDKDLLLNIEVVFGFSTILAIAYFIYVAKKTSWLITPLIMLMQTIMASLFFLLIFAVVAGGNNNRKEVVVRHEYD